MDKKKVVGIVVFIVLGLFIFTFANPGPSTLDPVELPGQGDKEPDQDKQPEEEQDDDDKQDDETDENIKDDELVDYYQLALNAVIKAEESLTQNDIDKAKDLINDVTGNKKEDLLDRINNVQNIIDFDKLLKELENKTNTATNKDQLDGAREFNLNNELSNKLNSLNDNKTKEDLLNRYNNLLPKLNDIIAPIVEGIENGKFTNQLVNLTITDNSSFTATLNGQNYITGSEINLDGSYTLIAIDDSFNETIVTFNIDTTAPEFTGILNGHQYPEVTLGLKEENIEEVVIYNRDLDKYYDFEEGMLLTDEGTYTAYAKDKAGNLAGIYGNGIVYFTIDNTKPEVINITQVYEEKQGGRIKVTIETSEEIFGDLLGSSKWRKVEGKNEYYNYYYNTKEVTISFYDKAGNEGTYSFVVDKTAPAAEITMSNNSGNTSTNKDVTVTLTASEDILDIEGWTKVDSKTFIKVFSENGKYSVEIIDLVGNKSTIKFEVKRIDKVPPVITVVEPNRYNIEVNTPYVDKGYSAYDVVDKDLTNRVTMTYQFLPLGSGNWEVVDKVDTSKLGTYKITYHVKDKAGNEAKATRSFEIVDSSLPVITVKEESIGTIEENIFSTVSFKLYDKHLITKVILNGEEKTLTPNSWSDLNYVSVGKNGGVYGKNTLVLVDAYGNETKYEFVLDNIVPQLKPEKWTVTLEADKNATFTCPDMTQFGTDEYGISKVELDQYYNDYLTNVDVTKPGNFVCRYITTDKAGNKASNDIFYTVVDTTKPEIKLDLVLENNYTNNGNVTITDLDSFDVVVKINGEEKHKYSGESYKRADLSWLGDGAYEIIVTDASGNVSTKTFTLDKTAPKTSAANILINGDSNNDKVFYGTYGDKIYTYVRFNEELKQIPTFKLINNGKEYVIDEKDITIRKNDNGEYQYSAYVELTEEFGMTDGEITMLVSNIEDKAGNKIDDITKPTNGHIVYLDTTPAGRVYSTLDFDGTGIVPEVDGTRRTYYIKNGSSFVFRMQFTEQLLENPILNVDNKQVELELVDKYVTEEGKYIYQGKVEINADDNFKDGILVLNLSNVKDLAGNETTDIKILDQTVTSNDRTAVIDNTAPEIAGLTIVGGTYDKDDNAYYANAEDYVYAYAVFNEKLNVVPTLKIEGKEYIMDSLYENNGTYRYYSREVKAGNLEEGLVNFEVYGYKDIAGNEGRKLENKDITLNSQSKVIVDTIAPTISISGTEGLNKNEYRIESGTSISLEDMLAIATDESFDGEIKIEPKRVDFLAPGSIIEDNIYNYDYKTNGFDTRKVGRYNIYYQVTDKAGNVSEEKLMMLVMTDTTAPVVTINGKRDIYVEFGSEYNELGATMTDNVDATITNLQPTKINLYDLDGNFIKNVTETGVDTTVEGRYLLYYDYVDGAGNSSKTDNGYTPYDAKRWVIVENTKDSVIEND